MFERALSQDEINRAKEKGIKKADKIFNLATNSENHQQVIRYNYLAVIACMSPLLDNFDENYFSLRGNDKKEDRDLKPMLLAAFQSVQCLEELERRGSFSLFKNSSIVEWYKERLSQAENVYRKNGRIDLCREPELKAA